MRKMNREEWIVVGLLALILVAAATAFSIAHARSARKSMQISCQHDLDLLDSAKESFALAQRLGEGAELTPDQLTTLGTYLQHGWAGLKCPCGGEYTVGKIGERPSCSFHGESPGR